MVGAQILISMEVIIPVRFASERDVHEVEFLIKQLENKLSEQVLYGIPFDNKLNDKFNDLRFNFTISQSQLRRDKIDQDAIVTSISSKF